MWHFLKIISVLRWNKVSFRNAWREEILSVFKVHRIITETVNMFSKNVLPWEGDTISVWVATNWKNSGYCDITKACESPFTTTWHYIITDRHASPSKLKYLFSSLLSYILSQIFKKRRINDLGKLESFSKPNDNGQFRRSFQKRAYCRRILGNRGWGRSTAG